MTVPDARSSSWKQALACTLALAASHFGAPTLSDLDHELNEDVLRSHPWPGA